MFLEVTKNNTLERWFGIAVPSERIFVLYLATAFILSVCVFFYYRFMNSENRPEKIDKGLFSYIFDKDVFLHRSARQDYLYFIINSLLYVGIISQLMVSTHFFTSAFLAVLQNIFGVSDDPLFTANLYFTMGYTIVSVLLLDFAIFITHYFQHKIPVLWQFHQVHHSAEVLTPITVYRMHPVDLFFTGLTAICLTSLGIAGYFYLTGEAAEAKSIYGVNIVLFVFYIVGYNLRHSHIWLNYPSWLSYIFISPAQHQIHHSSAEKHFDKNLGFIFSFWDWMFGTLYVPRHYEKLNYGIA